MKIGLALGAGGAKGLCHIAFLKALDDIGAKPSFIAGRPSIFTVTWRFWNLWHRMWPDLKKTYSANYRKVKRPENSQATANRLSGTRNR
jgi:hypothetical protein